MSVTPKIEFDNDGLPIPPKRKIEFDEEGLPIPGKVKVPKAAGEDFISKAKRIATQLVTNIKGPGGEIKTPEYPRTAGEVPTQVSQKEVEPIFKPTVGAVSESTSIPKIDVKAIREQKAYEKKIADETPKEIPYFGGALGTTLRAIDSEYSPIGQLGVGDFIDDMGRAIASGVNQGDIVTPANALLLAGKNASPEQIQKYIEAAKDYEKIGASDEMMKFSKTYQDEGKTIYGFLKGLAENPGVVGELIVSSVSAMANPSSLAAAGAVTGGFATSGAVGGGAPGATAGAISSIPWAIGAAGTALETGLTFSELLNDKLKENNLDFTEENVRALLEDEKTLKDIRTKSLARGATIGAIDALTGRLAGKVGAKLVGNTAASRVKAGLAASGIEMVGGSIGEASGRLVAGQPMDVAEIGLEGIAEGPMAIADVTSEVLRRPIYKINGENRTEADVQEIINTSSPEELSKINIDIKNDVKGYKNKIENIVLNNEMRNEIRQANPKADDATIDTLLGLENELKTFENNKTQSGKERASSIRSQIKTIQQDVAQKQEVVEPVSEAVKLAPEVPELTLTEQLSKRMAEIESEEKGAAGEVAPEVPAAEKVEQLRAAEQAEYAAMADPNDEVKRKEIYDKYDKLITPLLEKEKAESKAAPVPSIIEVKSPKEVKQGDTVVWRGEDFTVEEVNAKGGFNLQNKKDRTWTVKDARITDEEFGGKRGEAVPEAKPKVSQPLKDVESVAKSTSEKYLEQNPHSGGALTGNAEKFDLLPDDAEVFVYTATTPQNAEAILSGKTGYVPELQGQGIKGESNGIYVASDPRVVSGMGKVIVGFKVKKSDLKPSPEAEKAGQSLGKSVVSVGTGAILSGKPKLSFIAETQEAIGRSAKSGNQAVSEAYIKAKADGSNPELVKAVEDLLGGEVAAAPAEAAGKYDAIKAAAKPVVPAKPTSDELANELLNILGTPEVVGEVTPAEVYTKDNLDDIGEEGLSDVQKKVVNDVKNVVKSVSNLVEKTTGNELKVTIHKDQNTYGDAVINAGGTKQDSSTKGFYLDADGTIHLNMARVTSETMLHEGFHPVLDFIAKNNPEVIDAFYAQLGKLDGGRAIINEAIEAYRGSDETTIKKEAITDFVAKVADGSFELNQSNFEKVKSFILDLIKKLGFDLTTDVKDINDVKELAKFISDKFSSGKEIMSKEFIPVKNDGEPGEVSGAGRLDASEISKAKVPGKNPLKFSKDKFKEVGLVSLPEVSLEEKAKEFNNKAIAINSDPTRVGELTLPSGKKIFMYGGLNYTALEPNVNGEIGFASTTLSKPKQVSGFIKSLFPETDGVGLVLTTSQKPESMLGNAYSLEYTLDAISQLPSKVLRSSDFRREFFGKDIVAVREAFGEKEYNEFVKKYGRADLGSPEVIEAMVEELLTDIGNNFIARNSLVSNMLAGVVEKSTRAATKGEKGFVSVTPNKFIAKVLFDNFGLNQEKLFNEIGEKGIVDAYMNEGKWGFITGGFESDSKVDYMSIQDKGVIHPQFNAKFHGKNAFLLDGAYMIDKLFKPELLEKNKKGELYIDSKTGLPKPYEKKASLMVAGSMYPKGVIEVASPEFAKPIPQFSRPIELDVVEGFYSPIQKRILDFKQPKASATKWKEIVGVKSDEAVFSGLADWLNSQKPDAQLSKQDVLNFMKENRIEIKEVEKSTKLTKSDAENLGFKIENQYGKWVAEPPKNGGYQFVSLENNTLDGLLDNLSEWGIEGRNDTKYSQYQLPGGENYKEVLITLPFKKSKELPEGFYSERSRDGMYRVFDKEDTLVGQGKTEAEAISDALNEPETAASEVFKSSHFDEPNIITHLRMNTRTDADGKKVLFLEEVQSDWGQKGKREGFTSKEKDAEFEKLKNNLEEASKRLYEIENKLDDDYISKRKDRDESRSELRKRDSDYNKLALEYYTAEQAEVMARRAFDKFQVENRDAVEAAPFVTNTNAWVKLGLKYALKEAVRQGADRIAWTTGEQQNERYDLSKQVKEILYNKKSDNTYNVTVTGLDGREIYGTENATLSEIEANLGKDVAVKMTESVGDEVIGNVKRLKGENLKVGGKGMKAFYDKIVPDVAKSLVKELTGKQVELGEAEIDVNGRGKSTKDFDDLTSSLKFEKKLADEGKKGIVSTINKDGSYTVEWYGKKPTTQQSIDITPELRQSVQGGMPQFSRDNQLLKIKDFVQAQRNKGVSDDVIREALDKVAGKIGLTKQEIDNLMAGEFPTKPKEYAVQEQAAGEVPVQPKAGVSEEVEGGVPGAKPEEAPKEAKAEGKEEVTPGEMVGIKHEATEEMRLAYSLPEYERPEGKTMDELEAEADQKIKAGYNVETLIKKLEDGNPPSGVENVILAKYLGVLNADFDKTKNKETLAKIERVVSALDIIGTIQSEAFRTRKIMKPKEDTLAQYFMDEKADAGVEELTEQQEATITREYEEIKAAKEALQKKVEELQEQNAKLLAEGNIAEEKKKVKKTRKTDSDFKQERKNIVTNIKDKLKKARTQSNVTVVPYANELFTISPEIAKLVKSYVEQGIVKLEDIVNNIHELLKDDIKDITKKDVQDLIAGEYQKKKPTKNELAEKVRDLKTEAKLLVDYEKLEAGVPKTEKQKIEKNRNLADLRKRIKENDLTKLSEAKSRMKAQIEKAEQQIKKGDFEKAPEKKVIKLDEEGRKLQAKLTKLRKERDVRRLTLQYQKQNKVQRTFNKVLEVFNIPRSLMASTDFSAPLNQAVIATINYPKEAKEAAIQMVKAAASQEAFDNWFYDLKETPRYELMNKLKLGIADPFNPELQAREEAFMSGYAEQIPGLGKLVKGSERAYVQYLNKLRVDLFNKFVDKFENDGKTYENSKKLYESAAKYVNNITGRGELGKLQKFAPLFSALFFSPRLMAARINMLNPIYFATLPTELKKQYGKDMGTALGLLSTMLTLFALYGKTQDDDDEDKITVETDPRSSDFARIKQGDSRWDFSGGFQPYLRATSQYFSGQRKKTSTGEIMELEGKVPGTGKEDILISFFRNKLAPVPAMIWDFSTGKNAVGEKVELKDELLKNVIPLSFQSIYEGYEKKGPQALATVGLPAIFGVGVSTYEQRKKEVPESIVYQNRRIELTEEQRAEFQRIFDERNGKNIEKLKSLPEYKNADKIMRGELEQLVENKSLSESKEILGKKYRRDFLMQPKEIESREEKRVKQRFRID